MIDALQVFGCGYSWGGYESLLIAGYGKRTVRSMPLNARSAWRWGLKIPKISFVISSRLLTN